MSILEVIEVIRKLAPHQGFYSRLYARIMNCMEHDPELFNDFKEVIEAQKFKDSVDVCLFFEA